MKILILTYEFPPNTAVGAFRTWSWYKYLGEENDEITVVTRKWNGVIKSKEDYEKLDEGDVQIEINGKHKIYYVPYAKQTLRDRLRQKGCVFCLLFSKLLTLIQLFTIWLFSFGDEKIMIYKKARKLLKEENYDLIITSGEPFILFKYAFDLSKEFQVPYILDYRDAWHSSERHQFRKSYLYKLNFKFQRFFEKKYLLNSLFFITVSDLLKQQIVDDFRYSKGVVIRNGVDLQVINNSLKSDKYDGKFVISYSGTIYDRHDFCLFTNGLEQILSEGYQDLLILFIGVQLRPSKHSKKIFDLKRLYPNQIEVLDSMPQSELFSILKASQILLKFTVTETSPDAQSGKMYDYFAVKKPILHVIGGEAKDRSMFPNAKIEHFVRSQQEVRIKIEELYKIWKMNGDLTTEISDENIDSISRAGNAKILRNIIDERL
jgi:glycosyltransferase involved in cell wall biosynthesis